MQVRISAWQVTTFRCRASWCVCTYSACLPVAEAGGATSDESGSTRSSAKRGKIDSSRSSASLSLTPFLAQLYTCSVAQALYYSPTLSLRPYAGSYSRPSALSLSFLSHPPLLVSNRIHTHSSPTPSTLPSALPAHAAAAAATSACIPHTSIPLLLPPLLTASRSAAAAVVIQGILGASFGQKLLDIIGTARAQAHVPHPSPFAPHPLPLQFAYLHQTLNSEPKPSLLHMQLAGLRTSSPLSARTPHSRPSRVSACVYSVHVSI